MSLNKVDQDILLLERLQRALTKRQLTDRIDEIRKIHEEEICQREKIKDLRKNGLILRLQELS